jgi:CRISPR/Cas system-associated protein endoribonuclease Cas2
MLINNKEEKKQISNQFRAFLLVNGYSVRKFERDFNLKEHDVHRMINVNKNMKIETLNIWIKFLDKKQEVVKVGSSWKIGIKTY